MAEHIPPPGQAVTSGSVGNAGVHTQLAATTTGSAEQIEADPSSEDTFSDYSSVASETDSLTASVFNYTYENGRRYHAYRAGQYLLPNDEMEQDRLDMTHHIFRLTLNGELCMTKLTNPQSILDIGTGTGIWAIEMGDMFPSAEVIGTDLSPIQPGWVPPNVRFEIDDATQEWSFKEDSFDFIHARTLGGSIFDWPSFLKRCYDHIKPGGQIEVSEGRARFSCDDGTWPEDSYTWKWFSEFELIGKNLGLKFDIIPDIPDMLEFQGFKDVKRVDKIVPLGPWPKERALKRIGAFFRLQFLEMALEAYTLALFTRNGWTDAETQVLLAKVRNEISTNKMHIYTHCSYVTATKPKNA